MGERRHVLRAVHVRAAAVRLPRKQRAALVLRMYQELSHQEIATVLGLSETAAGTRLHRTLTKLRKACND